jgi:RNA polymerase sigma-70 factor (ECF subfamily)
VLQLPAPSTLNEELPKTYLPARPPAFGCSDPVWWTRATRRKNQPALPANLITITVAPKLLILCLMINTDTYPLWQSNNYQPAAKTEDLPVSDHSLARAAAQGDMKAFEELYLRHNRRVYSLCLRMTKNVSEAEDLAQEAFIQIFRKIGTFRGDAAFTTWLHRLTVNQVLMHFRKRSVKLEHTTDEGETPVQIVRGTEDPNKMPVLDRISLDRAIGKLPPGYRSVFVLHDIEGHDHEEISKLLGVAVGTSKSQLHKARMKLRGLLRKKVQ